jgi:glutaredoxin
VKQPGRGQNSLKKQHPKEMAMRTRLYLPIAVMVLCMQGLSFGEPGSLFARSPAVASQKTATVDIYVTDWCPYCTKAIKFLKARGIPYTAYDIEKDKNAAERKTKLSNRQGVPFAIINGKQILGFSEKAYSDALGLR